MILRLRQRIRDEMMYHLGALFRVDHEVTVTEKVDRLHIRLPHGSYVLEYVRDAPR